MATVSSLVKAMMSCNVYFGVHESLKTPQSHNHLYTFTSMTFTGISLPLNLFPSEVSTTYSYFSHATLHLTSRVNS